MFTTIAFFDDKRKENPYITEWSRTTFFVVLFIYGFISTLFGIIIYTHLMRQ